MYKTTYPLSSETKCGMQLSLVHVSISFLLFILGLSDMLHQYFELPNAQGEGEGEGEGVGEGGRNSYITCSLFFVIVKGQFESCKFKLVIVK